MILWICIILSILSEESVNFLLKSDKYDFAQKILLAFICAFKTLTCLCRDAVGNETKVLSSDCRVMDKDLTHWLSFCLRRLAKQFNEQLKSKQTYLPECNHKFRRKETNFVPGTVFFNFHQKDTKKFQKFSSRMKPNTFLSTTRCIFLRRFQKEWPKFINVIIHEFAIQTDLNVASISRYRAVSRKCIELM